MKKETARDYDRLVQKMEELIDRGMETYAALDRVARVNRLEDDEKEILFDRYTELVTVDED